MKLRFVQNCGKSFGGDQDGAVVLMFAFALFVMFGAVGAAVDYGRGLHAKSQLAQAADAAALAAAQHADQLSKEGASPGDAKQEGERRGLQVWSVNVLGSIAEVATPRIQLKNDVSGWSASITYSGALKTTIAGILGFDRVDVGGLSEAKAGGVKRTYMDFYLLLDNSQSMGIAATPQGINQLETLTGCQFGCHVTGQSDNYDAARANNIAMRIDTLRDATTRLLVAAENNSSTPDQYSFGLWTFHDQQTELSATTTDYSKLKQLADQVDLPTYEDGTQTDDAIAYLNGLVTDSGSGASKSDRIKFVFLVTDGVQDGIYTGWSPPPGLPTSIGSYNGMASPITPTACDDLKAKGITVAVLYTVYHEFAGTQQYDEIIAPIESDIPKNLEACASPGFYFEATTGPEIEPALEMMFLQAVRFASVLRLTK